jgi:hypothetical protein
MKTQFLVLKSFNNDLKKIKKGEEIEFDEKELLRRVTAFADGTAKVTSRKVKVGLGK